MGNGIDNISILIVLLVVFLFILTWGFNRISILRIRRKSEQAKDLSIIMTHTLNMSNNSVLRLSIRDHSTIFILKTAFSISTSVRNWLQGRKHHNVYSVGMSIGAMESKSGAISAIWELQNTPIPI